MKYLSDYMEEKQIKLFNNTRTFFAFSNKQFKEKAKKDTKYYDLGSGMFCPQENAKHLTEQLEVIWHESIKEDIEENGLEAIILRELGNYECWYVGNPTEAIEALKDYPVTKTQVIELFKNNWPD